MLNNKEINHLRTSNFDRLFVERLCNPEKLSHLVHNANRDVRASVAYNKCTSGKTLWEGFKDETDVGILEELTLNPNTPTQLLEHILEVTNKLNIIENVCHHPNVTHKIFYSLASKNNVHFNLVLLKKRDLPFDIFEAVTRDLSFPVLSTIAGTVGSWGSVQGYTFGYLPERVIDAIMQMSSSHNNYKQLVIYQGANWEPKILQKYIDKWDDLPKSLKHSFARNSAVTSEQLSFMLKDDQDKTLVANIGLHPNLNSEDQMYIVSNFRSPNAKMFIAENTKSVDVLEIIYCNTTSENIRASARRNPLFVELEKKL